MSLCNSTTATYREIMQQPDVWLKAYDLVCRNESNIKKFISENQIDKDTEIILTGAGTSAFIGDALAGLFVEKGFAHCRAVATTDMITYPEKYLPVGRPIVLVSFARSGNSPESMAAVRIADKYCEKVFHIVITCNEEGDLARESSRENVLLLLLPAETNDKSLAMTSSFSTMALVSLLVLNIKQLPEQKAKVEAAADFAREIIAHSEKALAEIATRPFKRAVFLGSGPLKGIAEECHLKLQELTDGTIVCKFDSFLGFRHGPKAVINKDTLLVYLCSNEERVLRYGGGSSSRRTRGTRTSRCTTRLGGQSLQPRSPERERICLYPLCADRTIAGILQVGKSGAEPRRAFGLGKYIESGRRRKNL